MFFKTDDGKEMARKSSIVETSRIEQRKNKIKIIYAPQLGSKPLLECEACKSVFFSKHGLRQHIKNYHPHLQVCRSETDASKIIDCPHCDVKFASFEGLKQHMRKKHEKQDTDVLNSRRYKTHIKCLECGLSFNRLQSLRNHLRIHDISIECHTFDFNSMAEFKEWKAELEKKTNTRYCMKHGSHGYLRYYCNRSGNYEEKKERKRKLKSQGTSKINFYCTSSIEVNNREDSTYEVKFYATHYGHLLDDEHTGHLRLHASDREKIKDKLSSGANFEEILQEYEKNSFKDGKPGAILTRKDLHNISRGIPVSKSLSSPSSKTTSQEQNECFEGIELFFKRQGDEHSTLSKETFALGFSSEYQLQCLTEFGNNIVCIELTQGNKEQEFDLITMLVCDKKGLGVPVAWLISNSQETVVFESFLDGLYKIILEKALPIPQPRYFMTDKVSLYFDGWCQTFEHVPNKVISPWYIQKELKGKLHLIKDADFRNNLYQELCSLLLEVEEDTAISMAVDLLSNLTASEATYDFGEYFQCCWLPILPQLCAFGREGSCLNPSMFIRPFHRIIKQEFLQKKDNTNVDDFVSTLLHTSRRLMLRMLRKEMKNKETAKEREIDLNHEVALNLSDERVRLVESGWMVRSNSELLEYFVKRIPSGCPYGSICELMCKKCNICCHEFSCTCIDAKSQSLICKHIHLVNIVAVEQMPYSAEIPVISTLSGLKTEFIEVQDVRDQIKASCESIINLTSEMDTSESVDTLKEIHDKLQEVLSHASTISRKHTVPCVLFMDHPYCSEFIAQTVDV